MKNKYILLISIMMLNIMIFSGCQTKNTKNQSKDNIKKTEVVKITTPNAPYSIPLFYMKEKNVLGDKIQLDIQIHKTGQEAIAKIMKEEVDMGVFGVQEAAKLYNKEVPIKLLNVSTWATFNIMTSRNDIKDWKDLKGKKIWLGAKGGPIDSLTQVIMKEKGIDPKKDVEINRLATKELSQMVMNNLKDIDIFILREPFISQVMKKNKNIKCVFDLGEEYKKIYNKKIPQGGTVVTKKLITTNKEEVLAFQEEYKKAIKWVKDNPKEAGELGEKYMKGFPPNILEASIKNMDMELINTAEARESLEFYYKRLLDTNAAMLDNKLPNNDFYTGLRNESK